MRKILITGGAGFIGSHLVRFFVNKYESYKIFNLDNLSYAGNCPTCMMCWIKKIMNLFLVI